MYIKRCIWQNIYEHRSCLKRAAIKIIEIAEQAGISFSELVRECLDAQLKARLYQEMRQAAEQLYADYSGDGDLTDMTSLDSESS